ncbi:MAG: DUF1848 family protein [Bacteroidales bacterium]
MVSEAKNPAIVISASRMTDLPAWYPLRLIEEIEIRRNKGQKIHTLVLWTKHPQSLLRKSLADYLEKLKREAVQLYIQLTISGMGGRVVGTDKDGKAWMPEPKAPDTQESLSLLPEIVQLTGSPDRIRLRIDPLLKIKDSLGKFYSNVSEIEYIVRESARQGIHYFSFSLVRPGIYRKVDRRFEKEGIHLLDFTQEDQDALRRKFTLLQSELGIRLEACSVEGWPTSACIDGQLLMQLHPEGGLISLKKPHSRPLCGCTHSIDIGGWPPKPCPTGCIYCYARPQR